MPLIRAILLFLLFLPVSAVFSANPTLARNDAALMPPPLVVHEVLANGLEVVIIPDHRAPAVTHMIWYKAGSADDPPGKSGIAHFLEHLMFKGTKTTPAGEFSRKVAEIGGQDNAFTTADYTAYYQRVSPEALEMVMRYEADRMQNVVLTDAMIEPERAVVLQERRSRVDANPGAKLRESAEATLFTHHPYGTPIIGWPHEIRQLTRKDAIAFYERYYTPDNAVLVVAGDIEPDTVVALAKATYGKIPRRAGAEKRKRIAEPVPVAARSVEYFDQQVASPRISRAYLVPSYMSASGRQAYALELLAAILGGSTSSRMYRRLVVEETIALSASSWYQGSAVDLTKFGFSATPRGDNTIEAIEQAIDGIIGEIIENGVNQAELDRARNRLIKETLFDRDSQVAMARIYGAVLSMGGTVADIENWPARMMETTLEEVNTAARQFLLKHRSVTSYLRPQT